MKQLIQFAAVMFFIGFVLIFAYGAGQQAAICKAQGGVLVRQFSYTYVCVPGFSVLP